MEKPENLKRKTPVNPRNLSYPGSTTPEGVVEIFQSREDGRIFTTKTRKETTLY